MTSRDGADDDAYADRLVALQLTRWKRLLRVQAPYHWNLRRLEMGRTLDVGCGIGRNLAGLPAGSVGVDLSPAAVRVARSRGLQAFTTAEFEQSEHHRSSPFESLLISHVLEHLRIEDSVSLIREYLGFIRAGGKVVLVTPQELGYRSDPTHVTWIDFEALDHIAQRCGLEVCTRVSFPFPRRFGTIFKYNEFCVVAANRHLPSSPHLRGTSDPQDAGLDQRRGCAPQTHDRSP